MPDVAFGGAFVVGRAESFCARPKPADDSRHRSGSAGVSECVAADGGIFLRFRDARHGPREQQRYMTIDSTPGGQKKIAERVHK